MTGDDGVQMLWAVGALVLVLSALTARRLSFGTIVRSVLGWIVIAAMLFLIFSHRDELTLLAERAGLGGQSVVGETVRIRQSADGHFYANARINGASVRMLVDSGATITAVSERAARDAGIQPAGGFPILLTTANGQVSAQRGVAETFGIGGLEVRDLSVVTSPSFGETSVVGMNFLSKLGSWRVEGTTLILEPNNR